MSHKSENLQKQMPRGLLLKNISDVEYCSNSDKKIKEIRTNLNMQEEIINTGEQMLKETM